MRTRVLASSAAVLGFAATLAAQAPPALTEFQVNTTTTDMQIAPSAASLGDTGNFVVTWTTKAGDVNYQIVARRFSESGSALGGEITVNQATLPLPFPSQVAAGTDGDFVVVWTDYKYLDLGYMDVRARRYDASGAPLSDEIEVNTYTFETQTGPAVSMRPTGEFIVVWHSGRATPGFPGQDGSDFGVFGQRFDASGVKVGGEFQVNEYTSGYQARPRVAYAPNGEFIVTWNSVRPGTTNAIIGRRFDANGAPLGGDFQVSTAPGPMVSQYNSDVAVDSKGRAIVAWQSALQDGALAGVYAQRLDAAGNKIGPEFNVNTYTSGNQARPRVALGHNDDFNIVWQGGFQDEPGVIGLGIYGQRYDPSGRRMGLEFPINTFTTGSQSRPAIASDSRGAFVVAWQSLNQDGSNYAVEGRLLAYPDGAPMKVDTRASGAVTNLNGMLDPDERVTVDPAFTNHAESSLALAGAAANLTGPGATAIYSIVDGSADYGSILPGGTSDCFTAAANCYEMFVGGTRPQQHWDATFSESVSTLAVKPWTLHVGGSFADVPQNAFYPFIENLFHNGVTGGCATGYCPGNNVTRAQMAVFLLKARWGAGFLPAPATGTAFADVPVSNPFAAWIEELVREGVTAGCGGGLYCPNNPVTRQQMAVFLLKTKYGSSYVPPPGAGLFGDVAPCPGTLCDFIEDLYNQQVTGGCQTSPALLYCPASSVLRQQMAVFLVKTFGLQLYGP